MSKKKKKTKNNKGKKYMTTTDLMTTNGKELVEAQNMEGYADVFIAPEDIVIPKITAMSGMSKRVSAGEAKVGEFVDSVNGEVLGSMEEPFEFVPFHITKKWLVEEVDNSGAKEYLRTEPVFSNPLDENYNDNLPFNDTENDKQILRTKVFEFYVLLPSEISVGAPLPYIIPFKSTSLRGGKKLLNHMYLKNKAAKLNPSAVVFELHGNWVENKKGKFIVLDVKPIRRSSESELVETKKWACLVTGSDVKVDDSDELEEAVPL